MPAFANVLEYWLLAAGFDRPYTSIKMLNVYFFILFVISLTIPVFIHEPLKRKIRSSSALMILEIFIVLIVLFIGIMMLFYAFFSPLSDNPKVTKNIDNQYYFVQQEYGWAGSMPGKHLEFFKRNTFWFDKKIGHIQWLMGIGDINAKIENDTFKEDKRIIITENNKLVLDTVLPFDKGFDFKYLTWRQ